MARYSDDELYRMLQKGRISDEDYVAGIEANCKHSNTDTEVEGDRWYDVCDRCGMTVSEGYVGSGGAVKVKTGGGCAVIGYFVLGALVTGLYGLIDLIA